MLRCTALTGSLVDPVRRAGIARRDSLEVAGFIALATRGAQIRINLRRKTAGKPVRCHVLHIEHKLKIRSIDIGVGETYGQLLCGKVRRGSGDRHLAGPTLAAGHSYSHTTSPASSTRCSPADPCRTSTPLKPARAASRISCPEQ